MKKVVVPLTTQRPVNMLLTWFVRFAIPALGLAGLDLMIPGPVEAENTTPRLLDYGGPLVERLAVEGITGRQAIPIIGFTGGTCGSVGIPARWARYRWVLSRGMGLLGAVR